MRVLIIAHYWHPHRGGVETVAREQARRLVQRGHQVSVVTSGLAGDARLAQDDGFPVYRVGAANLLEGLGIPYPLFSFRLLALLRRLVPVHDVILVHSHTFLSSVAGALAARRYNRPLVVLQHNPFVRYRFPWNLVESAADLVLGRFTLRSATRLTAVSDYSARYARGLVPGRRVDVVHNGVATQDFTPAQSRKERQEIRSRLGLPCRPFIVLTVRRLVFRNGLDTLLEACARLKERNEILVVIGGSGPQRALLEQFIRQAGLINVRLVGFVPDDRLANLYRAADVFVLPTRTGEGFGLVLLEAFASGIPVIATNGGAQEEVVCEGQTGLLVPPESPAALADAIVTLKDQPELVARMGSAARTRALEMDWERTVDRLEEFLTEAVRV